MKNSDRVIDHILCRPEISSLCIHIYFVLFTGIELTVLDYGKIPQLCREHNERRPTIQRSSGQVNSTDNSKFCRNSSFRSSAWSWP